MKQEYINKEGVIRAFTVIGDKVMTNIYIDDRLVCNPTLDQFLNSGWSVYVKPDVPTSVPEPYIPLYSELVERYIREHGYKTYGAELAVINNYAVDKKSHQEAYDHYMQVREEAKTWASEQPHRGEENV